MAKVKPARVLWVDYSFTSISKDARPYNSEYLINRVYIEDWIIWAKIQASIGFKAALYPLLPRSDPSITYDKLLSMDMPDTNFNLDHALKPLEVYQPYDNLYYVYGYHRNYTSSKELACDIVDTIVRTYGSMGLASIASSKGSPTDIIDFYLN